MKSLFFGAIKNLFCHYWDPFLGSPRDALKAKIEIGEFVLQPMANMVNPLPGLALEVVISEIDKEEGFSLFDGKVNRIDPRHLGKLFSRPMAQSLELRSYGLFSKSRFKR